MTANATVDAALGSIRDINENIARLQEEAKEAREKAVEPFLQALADSGEVSVIAIYGYTPGFNDGEPCTHSAEYFVNVKQVVAEERHEEFDISFPDEMLAGLRKESDYVLGKGYVEDPGAAAHNAELCKKFGHVYAKPSEEIMQAISDVLFDLAEEENETDYFVTYVLKDGKFVKNEGDYDCGY